MFQARYTPFVPWSRGMAAVVDASRLAEPGAGWRPGRLRPASLRPTTLRRVSTASYPGASLGLPETGVGSLASWGSRIGALLIDWGASMLIALGAFGQGVMVGTGWRVWMPLAVFFVMRSLLTAFTGSSFGQLISGIGVVCADGTPVRPWQALVRAALLCVVLPAVVMGPDRRALTDVLLGTVVVRRRP